jgi:SOS-response transcriptional repressor LexA
MDIENESGGIIYQKLLNRIELGQKDPMSITLTQFQALLKALDWTPLDFYNETGLKIPGVSYVESVIYDPAESHEEAVARMMHMEPFQGTVRLPVWGTVSAGIQAVDVGSEPERYVRFDRAELPRGVEVEKLVLLRVNGDSMLADNVPRPIPPGSMVMVELAAAPSEGDVVVAWIEPLSTGVLKLSGRLGDEAYLRSYKPGGPSFWGSHYPDMRVVGVVRRVIYEP